MTDDKIRTADQQSTPQTYLEFGLTQTAIFASVAPSIEAFAQQHRMDIARQFDRDPMKPFACYFLKPGKRCFSASTPLTRS